MRLKFFYSNEKLQFISSTCNGILFAVGTYADEPERIVNGIPTTIEQHPFAISMRDAYNNHMCGGAIISDRFILTAGHCVQPILNNPGAIRVFTGTTYLNKGGVAHRVERMALHERYPKGVQGRPVGFDIGLIKVRFKLRMMILPSFALYRDAFIFMTYSILHILKIIEKYAYIWDFDGTIS